MKLSRLRLRLSLMDFVCETQRLTQRNSARTYNNSLADERRLPRRVALSKYFYFSLLVFSFSFAGAQSLPDSGFTNKAEARIDTLDHDETDGKWISYFDSNGEFEGGDTAAPFYLLTVIKNGKPFGIEREFYKDGKLRYMLPYTDGARNGTEKGYYESGALRYIRIWMDDDLNGICKGYYEDGKLMYEKPYRDGRINGISKTFDEKGKLESAIPYTNGSEDPTIKIDENGNEIK